MSSNYASHFRNDFTDQILVKNIISRALGTKQVLLFNNSFANFVADNPADWLEYMPQIIGGNASKTKDDSHLQIIKKYSLLLTLMS